MVMFTLAKTADSLKLNNPYNICIIYRETGTEAEVDDADVVRVVQF